MARRPSPRRQPKVPGDKPSDGLGYDDQIQGADAVSAAAWNAWRQTQKHLGKWRDETKESYDFVAGHQWDQADIDKLTEQQRPVITFNRTGTVCDSVSGYEINGRQDVTYQPRTVEDSGPAEVESDAARFFREQCDAEDEESDAFYDVLVCGIGVIEHRMDYDDDPEGMLKVERGDPMEFGWDPAAKKRNLADRRWDIRGQWIDIDEARKSWPDADFSKDGLYVDDDQIDQKSPINVPENAFYRSGSGDDSDVHKNQVFILEYTWFEQEPFYSMPDPATGQLAKLTPDQHKKLQSAAKAQGLPALPSAKRSRKVFKRAFVHGQNTLNPDDLAAPCPTMFHYQFMTGKRDRNKNIWFGLVRLMKDPQRWANKWMSQQLHIINSNAKGGIAYEDGAFQDVADVEQNASKPGKMLKVEPGYWEKWRELTPSMIPTNVFELMQFAISSLRDVTGVNVELLGMADRDQPGVLEHSRKQSAMAILAPIFDSQRRYRKNAGRLTLYFIQEFLSDGRLIRITGPDGAAYAPLTKKPGFVEYDVIVDQAPTAPNQKEAAFASITQILPALMKMGVPTPPEVLDYIPGLPAKLADDWKKLLTQPNPQAQARTMLEGLEKLADIEEKAAHAEEHKGNALKAAGSIALDTTDVVGNLLIAAHQVMQGQGGADQQPSPQFPAVPGQPAPAPAQPPMQPSAPQPPMPAPAPAPQAPAASPPQPGMNADLAQLIVAALRGQPMPGNPEEPDDMDKETRAVLANVAESLKQQGDAIGQGMAQMAQAIAGLAHAAGAETELVRGPDGRVAGARKKVLQ